MSTYQNDLDTQNLRILLRDLRQALGDHGDSPLSTLVIAQNLLADRDALQKKAREYDDINIAYARLSAENSEFKLRIDNLQTEMQIREALGVYGETERTTIEICQTLMRDLAKLKEKLSLHDRFSPTAPPASLIRSWMQLQLVMPGFMTLKDWLKLEEATRKVMMEFATPTQSLTIYSDTRVDPDCAKRSE